MDDEDLLLSLASKYLTPETRPSAKRLLAHGDFYTVRSCLLRAIDFSLAQGDVDYQEAEEDYKLLGFTRDEACEIRQRAAPIHFNRSSR